MLPYTLKLHDPMIIINIYLFKIRDFQSGYLTVFMKKIEYEGKKTTHNYHTNFNKNLTTIIIISIIAVDYVPSGILSISL